MDKYQTAMIIGLLIASVVILIGTAVYFCVSAILEKKNDKYRSSFGISKMLLFSACLLCSVWCLRYAVGYYSIITAPADNGSLTCIEEIFNSVLHALQTFSTDEDYSAYITKGKEMLRSIFGAETVWQTVYGLYASVMNVVAPIAGGATAAARLRRLDEKAEIIVLERGEFVSFANCGLPYYIGGVITEKSALTLQTPQSFKTRFNVEVRTFNEAVNIDPSAKTVTVKNLLNGETYEETYDNLVISPGAAPIKPNIEGIESENVFTLRNIPDTFRIKRFMEENSPKTAVVVGGGYIGIEMAENLAEAGLKVSVVELSDHLIASLDGDMAADLHRYLRSKGIDLYLSNGVTAIRGDRVVLHKGECQADMVLLSVGVRPETELARKCGISLNDRGSIIVNRRMQTNIPHIYAVGDAVEAEDFITKKPSFIPLAGPANKQGRIAADNIAGYPTEYTGTQGSAVLKVFDMTVATTGLNEKNARLAGIDYDKTYIFSAPHATYYPGGTNMSIKVLWDKNTHKLLGAQIVGFDGVDKRLDVFATAIRLGASVTDLTTLELCYAPPFGSAKDPVNMIGFVAENTISGKQKQFFWHDVDSLPRDGSVYLLDTRTPAEYARSNIEGFVNIPLDSLRQRLDEIPTDKPVYVHCHSGHRSYIACRILSAHGIDCYNLAGGWRLYDSVMSDAKHK